MLSPRKLTFQLTPLLDLLLIVIFAQYLDVASTTRKETVELASSRDLLSQQLDEALKQLVALRTRLNELQDEVQTAQLRSDDAERFRVQRDLVGELIADMFKIPDAVLEPLISRMNAAGPGPSDADIQQLRARLKGLSGNSSERVVEHLLAFGEMRKRIDLWELYLNERGELTLNAGGQAFRFRAESSQTVVLRLFEAYKTLPETKGMVLLLVSYGDARAAPLDATVRALPIALERIRQDTGNRARFEYAVLGFRSSPPATTLN